MKIRGFPVSKESGIEERNKSEEKRRCFTLKTTNNASKDIPTRPAKKTGGSSKDGGFSTSPDRGLAIP